MTDKRMLKQALFDVLPIPRFMRRHVAVERALQERQAAGTALECLGAHLLCLKEELDGLASTTPEGRQSLARMKSLVSDMETCLVYDELEVELAAEEI